MAAAWANYTWEMFLELDGDSKSAVIASYDCAKQIEAVVAYEQMKEMRRRANNG